MALLLDEHCQNERRYKDDYLNVQGPGIYGSCHCSFERVACGRLFSEPFRSLMSLLSIRPAGFYSPELLSATRQVHPVFL
jgi:hypothetical protein